MPATILGEHYQITATAEGYASATATDIVVADNAVTVVAPDAADPATPTALLLQPINGDFDLCAVSQVGGCTPISFSNQNSVRVHLRDDNGVTRVRAAAGALPSEATLPLTAYDDDLGVVIALPDTQGNIAIFADVERDGARASGVAFCSDGVACTVLLPSLAGVVAEQRHDLFAFVCDAAGNCSTTAGRSAVVFDNTPPSALNGVGFAPTGSAIVGSRPRFRTRSGAYAVAIDVGEAASKDGVPVVDIAGDPVRDVDAVALSFVAAIDDDDADSLVGADLPGAQAVIAGLPLLGGEADYDVFARFIDAAGNATAIEPNPFGFTLTLDETAPTGRLDFAGGANITNSRTVAAAVINLSETGTLAKLVADAGSTATALSCAASTGYVAFATSVAVSVALADPSGSYVVDACFEDAAGNRTALPASDSILFDTTPPTVTLVLNDNDTFTTSSEVRGAITAVDDLATAFVGMRFSSSTTFAGNSEGFATARAGLVLAAPTVEGSKTLCVEVTDELGRTAADCDDIVLDLQAPAGTLTAPAFATASPLTVSIRSDDLNIASVAVGEGLDCANATFTALATAATVSRTVTLTDVVTAGGRSIVACFKDAAGRVTRVERTTVFDFTDPPLATTIAPSTGAVVATKRPLFSWSAVEGAASYQLIVRRIVGAAVVLSQAGLSGLQHTPTADLPEAALEWIVVVTKSSGRSSVQSFTSAARVTPDVTAPTAASGLVVAVDANRSSITAPAPCSATVPCINDNTPRLSFTAGTDLIDTALVHTLQIATANDAVFAAPVFTIARADGSVFDVGFPLEDGAFKIRVRSVDDAGNVATSAVKDIIIDRAAPDAPSILPLQSPVSSVLPGDIRAGWTPKDPAVPQPIASSSLPRTAPLQTRSSTRFSSVQPRPCATSKRCSWPVAASCTSCGSPRSMPSATSRHSLSPASSTTPPRLAATARP